MGTSLADLGIPLTRHRRLGTTCDAEVPVVGPWVRVVQTPQTCRSWWGRWPSAQTVVGLQTSPARVAVGCSCVRIASGLILACLQAEECALSAIRIAVYTAEATSQ